MQSGDVNQLIEKIITHEVNLEKMYQQFAKSHPIYRQFWSQLAREEAMHVKWIKSLARYYENGQINLSNFNLAPQAVKTSTAKHRLQLEALYSKLSQN